MSQLSHDRVPFGQKFAFSSSHYTSGLHPRLALSVRILPVCHFAVHKLPNLGQYGYQRLAIEYTSQSTIVASCKLMKLGL